MTGIERVFTGRVLTEEGIAPRRVTVRDGRIVSVEPISDPASTPDPDPATDAETITLAEDEVLLPGLVDTHVHVNEPGRTEWEGFATATRAAAAGGVTTILDMPLNSIPATTSLAALRVKQASATGQCSVDVGFWAAPSPTAWATSPSCDRRRL